MEQVASDDFPQNVNSVPFIQKYFTSILCVRRNRAILHDVWTVVCGTLLCLMLRLCVAAGGVARDGAVQREISVLFLQLRLISISCLHWNHAIPPDRRGEHQNVHAALCFVSW